MKIKQNVNKNSQPAQAQVTELGAATELTLGRGNSQFEGSYVSPSRNF